MFEQIDFDEFFSKYQEFLDSKDEILAVTVITPSQTVHAYLLKDSQEYLKSDYEIGHKDIIHYILGEIFKIECEVDIRSRVGREKKSKRIGAIIKNLEMNFVTIRYVISELLFCASVEIPAFITRYQYDELLKLNEKFKQIGFDIGVVISNYNPFFTEKDKKLGSSVFEEKTNISLDLALDFLQRSNRIIDYVLPFKKENILASSNKKLS